MTKTIEEVKAAKRELESKISQMVNEFAKTYGVLLDVRVRSYDAITVEGKFNRLYVCETEIKL